MNMKIAKSILAGLLAATLILVITISGLAVSATPGQPPAAAAASPAQATGTHAGKTEVVYAKLAADGKASSAYVVNRFEVTGGGSFTDYGDYASVVNMTNTSALVQQSDSVTFYTNGGEFYYQGNITVVKLPWFVDIAYTIDGIRVEPQELAGQSGKLGIRVTTRQNGEGDPVFYENYMLQITVLLSGETCADISAQGATLSSSGGDIVVTYTVLPEKDADYTLTALVNDFEMKGIQLAGIPMSFDFDLPDTDEMLGDFDKLTDAIGELSDGVDELTIGAEDLSDAARELKSGSKNIEIGLSQLADNAQEITTGSDSIRDALVEIASSISGSFSNLVPADIQQLPAALTQLADGLSGISGGLTTLSENFAVAYAALDSSINGIPEVTLTQEQIGALYAATNPEQYAALDTLVAYYAAGLTVKGTYTQVKAAFDAVATTTDSLCESIDGISAALRDIATQMTGALSELDALGQLDHLASGLTQLSDSYESFDDGLATYLDGVVTLSDGYATFHSGLSSFVSGTGDYYDGMEDLRTGMGKLNDETADLPDEVQDKIDDLMSEYSGEDFTPVSFTHSS